MTNELPGMWDKSDLTGGQTDCDRGNMMKMLSVTMPDGSKWGVPVEMIARNRAEHYAHEFDGDIERSLAEDTMPLFDSDDYEIEDWAVNNMNWSDFDGHQVKLADFPVLDFQDGWLTGEKEVIEHDELPKSDLTGGQTDCDRAAQEKMREFEQWYVENAFDYVSNPIGSRDCGLQRKAWQASAAQSAETIARLEAESKRIDEENRTLRHILSECASALDNGSVASPDCSMRFLSDIPKEIAAETKVRKQKLAAAQADNARLREALNDIASPNSNHEIFTNAPAGMTLDRMYEEIAQAALAQRLDTSALDAYVAKKIAWQPIETAPKDGTFVLVANRSGAWIACYRKYSGSGFEFPNPWMSMMLNHDHMERSERWDAPTHWMPLPPAPDKQNK